MLDSSDINAQSNRSRSSTRLPAASSGGQVPSRFRSASRQNCARRAPSTDPQSRLADPNRTTERATKLYSSVRAPSPTPRGRPRLNPQLQHNQPVLQPANSRIPVRNSTPPLPGSELAPKPCHSQLPRTGIQSQTPRGAMHSPARPPHSPLLPRMFSPSESYLQGSKGLHERGLAALKEYRRMREIRMQQALKLRQQQHIPQNSNGHLKYTIQQPPFLAGRPRTNSNPPNHHLVTPTRSGSRGRGASQSPLSAATRTPFSSDRPRTARRGSSVCSDRRGTLFAAQRSGSGSGGGSITANTPPATPPDHNHNNVASSTTSSPAMLVARGPALKITPKVTPKLRTRTGDPRTDSQMHAEGRILQPQSPPSLRLQDQSTEATLTASSAPTEDGGAGGGMEDLLLQQEKSSWTSEKQRLEKEVEQLHELIEYLFEQFNIPMDDCSVPWDELTGLPQYIPGSDPTMHAPGGVGGALYTAKGAAENAASAELPPSFGGSFMSHGGDPSVMYSQSAQLPPMHGSGANSMMGAVNGRAAHYSTSDLPSAPREELSSAELPPRPNRNSHSGNSHTHASRYQQQQRQGRRSDNSASTGSNIEGDIDSGEISNGAVGSGSAISATGPSMMADQQHQQPQEQRHPHSMLSAADLGASKLAPAVPGPVGESDVSFISMLCDGMTMMSASDTPHSVNLSPDKSSATANSRGVPLVVDGPSRR